MMDLKKTSVFVLGLLLPPAAALGQTTLPAQQQTQAQTPLQEALAKLTPQQLAAMKAYEKARSDYNKRVAGYWREIALKKKLRSQKAAKGLTITAADYVKTFPPVYSGPKRPDDVYAQLPKPPKPPVPETPHERVAVVSDFLAAADEVYGFKPDRISDEEFMIYYAIESVKLGLRKDQVVRVYALETGGTGTADLQSGYNPRTGKAASTALGFAQLLAANSIEQVRKQGSEFASRLETIAAEKGFFDAKGAALKAKAAVLRRMHADAKAMPDRWSSDVGFAKTPKGLAMHALNLDGDIGPWMQVVKLRDIKDYAARKGKADLTGAELELMNLAGPAHGFEMMQGPGRDAPTANFFDRGGYERNPVVHDRTGALLLAKFNEIMDRNGQKVGAQKFAEIFDTIARKGSGGAPGSKSFFGLFSSD